MTENGTEDVVAFLGPSASYSHQAALRYFHGKKIQLAGEKSFQDVFAAVQSSSAKFGVVPVENSSNGPVDMTLDCLIDARHEYEHVRVFDETFVDVKHCLLGSNDPKSDRTDPIRISRPVDLNASQSAAQSPDMSAITDVYSHPQALGQCRNFIQKNLHHAKLHEVASTSEAAAMVAQMRSPSAVAIASQLAGELFGLKMLASTIQDQADNQTRFLLLQRNDSVGYNDSKLSAQVMKTLFAFGVKHDVTGALADALHIFKLYSLNLTSINERPSGIRPWHYIFLVEAEFTADSRDTEDRLKPAIEDLRSMTETLKCLGSWPIPG